MNRPWYLTVLLVLMGLGSLFSLYSYTLGSSMIAQTLPDLPSWYTPFLAVLALVELVAVYMTWNWQKNGVYLIYGITVVSALLNMMYLGVSSVIAGAIGAGLVYLATKSTWKNFK